MECLAMFFVLLLAGVIAASALGGRIANRRGRRRLLQQLAKQFSGAYDPGGFFSTPLVRLRYGETCATITKSRGVGPIRGSALQMRLAWPHSHIRCEILAAGVHRPEGNRYSWPRISLEHTLLNPSFVVLGIDEAGVRQLLSSGVCWQLEKLRVLGNDHRLHVLIVDGQIVVQKYWGNSRGGQHAQIVQGALDLYDQCMLAKASGIEFLHTDEAQMLEDVTCKICGETIEDDLVFCCRCKTPHHQECWRYVGLCSVFGCRETVYLLPQQDQTPPPLRSRMWPFRTHR